MARALDATAPKSTHSRTPLPDASCVSADRSPPSKHSQALSRGEPMVNVVDRRLRGLDESAIPPRNVAADTANGIRAELPRGLRIEIVAEPQGLLRNPEASADAYILITNHWRTEYHRRRRCGWCRPSPPASN